MFSVEELIPGLDKDKTIADLRTQLAQLQERAGRMEEIVAAAQCLNDKLYDGRCFIWQFDSLNFHKEAEQLNRLLTETAGEGENKQ